MTTLTNNSIIFDSARLRIDEFVPLTLKERWLIPFLKCFPMGSEGCAHARKNLVETLILEKTLTADALF